MRTALAAGGRLSGSLGGAVPATQSCCGPPQAGPGPCRLQRRLRPLLRGCSRRASRVSGGGQRGSQQATRWQPPTPATPYWQLALDRPTVLLLGNEAAGVAPDLLALLQPPRHHFPTSRAVESLETWRGAAPFAIGRACAATGRMPA